MTVLISKPAFNLREALTSLKRKIGLKGAEIMAAETVDDVYNVIGTNRNLLINGDFSVSQRGDYSTATATTSSTYYLDRWCMDFTSAAACTLQRQLVTLPNGNKTYSAKMVATGSTSSGSIGMFQVVEDYRTLSGKQVTFSAWIKTNTSDVYFRHYSNTNVGSAAPSDGQWHYVTATYAFPVVTQGVRGSDGTGIFIIKYRDGASIPISAGDYIEIAQFQLELGSVATPFEHRPYATELALCQRYYWQTLSRLGGGYAFDQIGQGFIRTLTTTASPVTIQVPYPVPMRSSPSIGTTNGVNFTCQVADTIHSANGGLSVWSSGNRIGWVDLNVDSTSGWSVGGAVSVYCQNGASDMFFSAEL